MIYKLIEPFKHIWQFVLANVLLGIVFNLILWNDSFENPKFFLFATLWSMTISLTQWLGNTYFGIKVSESYSWLDEPKKRLFAGIVTIVVYSSVAYILVQFFMNYIFFGETPDNAWKWVSNQLKFTVPISLLIAFTFNSIGFFKAWKNAELNAQKLESEMLRYKYESLQNQINPHFLFNSFNVLSELVTEDQQLAVKFIDKLSSLYRYVLESKEKELVPLSEEVEFLESFIFLLKIRFENKVEFNWKVDKNEKFFIVPMALQLLVENAVKHNIATSKKVLKINIEKQGEFIVVNNNLQEKSSVEHSTKKGLKNLKQQYSFFTEKEIEIEKTAKKFEVKIPLLEKQ